MEKILKGDLCEVLKRSHKRLDEEDLPSADAMIMVVREEAFLLAVTNL